MKTFLNMNTTTATSLLQLLMGTVFKLNDNHQINSNSKRSKKICMSYRPNVSFLLLQ